MSWLMSLFEIPVPREGISVVDAKKAACAVMKYNHNKYKSEPAGGWLLAGQKIKLTL